MQKNNHKINDYDMVLDAKFGKRGTSEREMNEDKARDFTRRKSFCKPVRRPM